MYNLFVRIERCYLIRVEAMVNDTFLKLFSINHERFANAILCIISLLLNIMFFRRNIDPPIWYDTDVRLFEIQRV